MNRTRLLGLVWGTLLLAPLSEAQDPRTLEEVLKAAPYEPLPHLLPPDWEPPVAKADNPFLKWNKPTPQFKFNLPQPAPRPAPQFKLNLPQPQTPRPTATPQFRMSDQQKREAGEKIRRAMEENMRRQQQSKPQPKFEFKINDPKFEAWKKEREQAGKPQMSPEQMKRANEMLKSWNRPFYDKVKNGRAPSAGASLGQAETANDRVRYAFDNFKQQQFQRQQQQQISSQLGETLSRMRREADDRRREAEAQRNRVAGLWKQWPGRSSTLASQLSGAGSSRKTGLVFFPGGSTFCSPVPGAINHAVCSNSAWRPAAAAGASVARPKWSFPTWGASTGYSVIPRGLIRPGEYWTPRLVTAGYAKPTVEFWGGSALTCDPANPILSHYCSGESEPSRYDADGDEGEALELSADDEAAAARAGEQASVNEGGPNDACARSALLYSGLVDAIAARRKLAARPSLSRSADYLADAQAKVAGLTDELESLLGDDEGKCPVAAGAPAGGIYVVLEDEVAGVDPFRILGASPVFISAVQTASEGADLPEGAVAALFEVGPIASADAEEDFKEDLEEADEELSKALDAFIDDEPEGKSAEGEGDEGAVPDAWLDASVGLEIVAAALKAAGEEEGADAAVAVADLEALQKVLRAAKSKGARFFFAVDSHMTPGE